MSGKKLWLQSPHLNHCSVSSSLPWHWLLLHSPVSDYLIVMMVSHLVLGLLLVSCVFALDGPPRIHTHTPTHINICVHSKAPYKCHVLPLYIPFKVLRCTSHFHFLCSWDLGRMNTHHICSDNPLHLTPLNRWDESMCLLDTNCSLFNQPFGNQLQEEYGQVSRKVLHSLIHPSPSLASGKGACYNTSFPPLSRLVETREVTFSCCHCHQKSCSIWQTETDGLLLREACFVDTVQPEGPKHHFSVVIGNMIERKRNGLSTWPSQEY